MFKYHGNYCGPGYTDGEYKNSEFGEFNLEPIDQLDNLCKQHDKLYKQGDYLVADQEFIKHPSTSFKHYLAKQAIRAQSLLRQSGIMEASNKKSNKNVNKKKNNNPKMKNKNKNKRINIPKIKIKRSPVVPVAIPVPKKMSNTLRINRSRLDSRKKLHINGREYLGLVNVTTTTDTIGSNIFTQNIAPQDIIDSRLKLFATMYEKYRFTKVRFHYVPQVPTSQAGQHILWCDYDPADVDPTGTDAVVRAFDSSTNVSGSFYEPTQLLMNQNLKQTSFYTSAGADDRIETQAVLKMTLNSNLGLTTDITMGSIYMEYEIDFYGAEFQLDSSTLIGHSRYITDATHNDTQETHYDTVYGANKFTPTWYYALDTHTHIYHSIFLRNGIYDITIDDQLSSPGSLDWVDHLPMEIIIRHGTVNFIMNRNITTQTGPLGLFSMNALIEVIQTGPFPAELLIMTSYIPQTSPPTTITLSGDILISKLAEQLEDVFTFGHQFPNKTSRNKYLASIKKKYIEPSTCDDTTKLDMQKQINNLTDKLQELMQSLNNNNNNIFKMKKVTEPVTTRNKM